MCYNIATQDECSERSDTMNLVDRANKYPEIGDIYLMNFGGSSSEQRGLRPGLVFQNNLGNRYSPNIIALPLTSSIKKVNQPTHVYIPSSVGLMRDSIVLCENPERMSKDKLGTYLLTLPEKYMSEIAIASLLATSVISFIDLNSLISTWQKAASLNAVS